MGGYSGGGIVETFGYDSNRLQMTSQTVTQSGSTRLSLSYSYAASSGQMGGGSTAGNAGQLMSVSGSIGGQTESAAYTYDNVGRLVTSNQTSNGVSAQRRFVYDRWGNRTEVYDATSGGSQIQAVSLDQSGGIPTNRIASVTEGSTLNYSYDSAGNVTSDGAHSYTYDAENRVVSVDGGSTATYSYDHQNRRIKKTVGSTTTHYVWQGGQCIAEHNGSTGAMVNEYIFAGSRMIAREGGGRVYFLYDRLSARATIADGQGGIQGRQSHLPFGEELNATGTTDKHRFTSYERDSETGSDYAVNRGYSASVGRFNQADPYEGSYFYDIPQSLNRYAYVESDPINALDPLGLWEEIPPPILGPRPLLPRGIGGRGEGWRWNPGERGGSGGGQGQRKRKMSEKDKFKKFLNSEQNKACRDALNAAYQDTIGGSVSEAIEGAVDQVDFYDTNLFPNEEAGVHFPSFLIANGIANGIAVSTVFGPGTVVRGQRVLAVTESPLSGLGSPGIYVPGGQAAPVFQGNDGFANIQHELAHYVTNKGDADFARDLGISDGDVKGWFERGCKNKAQE